MLLSFWLKADLSRAWVGASWAFALLFALTARRLADAQRAGCDLAVVTTSPGSKSQENAQRHGFELLYARAILVR